MTLPLCTTLLNTNYFSNVQKQVKNASTPSELQKIINQVYSDISLLESGMQSQVDLLGPLAALVNPPTNPSQVISWISNFITGFIEPYVKPLAILPLQIAELNAQAAELTAVINEVQNAKFPNVTITVPTIEIYCSY